MSSSAWLPALLASGGVYLLARPPATLARGRGSPLSGAVPTWAQRWWDRWREGLRGGWLHRRRRSQAAQLRAADVLELVEVMAAELRAGQPPTTALDTAAATVGSGSVPPPVVAAARSGGPVADLLDVAAAAPGARGLHALAACWRVSEQSGVGLARGLARVVVGLRDEQQLAAEVAGQLAAPRATGRLLAVLPAFGWLLGTSLGAAPLEVLFSRSLGWVCLAVGVPLQLAGWWWMERLAASVDPWRR